MSQRNQAGLTAYMFPGVGAQSVGMGSDLFKQFPEFVAVSDNILGYSIKELCLDDPENLLSHTQFLQPALFVVSVLHYLERRQQCKEQIDFFLGHGCGELAALYAAGVFDFATGLTLIKRRSELMADINQGGMATVVNLDGTTIEQMIDEHHLNDVSIAMHNAPDKCVIAGSDHQLNAIKEHIEQQQGRYFTMRTPAAYYSQQMEKIEQKFLAELADFSFQPPNIDVISNATGEVYPSDVEGIKKLLARQLSSGIRWHQSINMLLDNDVRVFHETGPGTVLSRYVRLCKDARRESTTVDVINESDDEAENHVASSHLGSSAFCKDYGVDIACVAGGMYKGVSSPEMVIRMANNGMLGFLGVSGQAPAVIETSLEHIRAAVGHRSWGVSLFCHYADGDKEMKMIDLLLRHSVNNVELAGFVQVTPAIVRYRLLGLRRTDQGQIVSDHRIIVKASRPEVTEAFLKPAPERIIRQLVAKNQITEEQARLARLIPVAHDVCVAGECGGHTERYSVMTNLPVIKRQAEQFRLEYGFHHEVRVGVTGGLGCPEAIAAAFMLGADFIVTGSVNLCTVEAGMSDMVKELLASMSVSDTELAPSGDLFELGGKIQVYKKGVFFPARANKLYDLWQHHSSLKELDESTVYQLERNYFKASLDEVWQEVMDHYSEVDPDEIYRAERHARHKMALIFRWYFIKAHKLAVKGEVSQRVDFQIQVGPALGVFNQWVAGTTLESWQSRHVDEVNKRLMKHAEQLLKQRRY